MVAGLAVQGLTFAYGAHAVLRGVTVPCLAPGTVTALLGPNAAGKTTLLKCMAGLLKGQGAVCLDGVDIGRYPLEQLTRRVAYLPQDTNVPGVLTVFESVLLARQPAVSWRVQDADLAAVWQVIVSLGLEPLAQSYLNELSGGQRQLVSIAHALVRQPRVLLLDEPTSSLDLQHQLEVLALVRSVAAETGASVVISLHDLNLAARHADRLLVLHGGRACAIGPPCEVLTPELLRTVYAVEAEVSLDSDGVPHVAARSAVRRTTTHMRDIKEDDHGT